jgi:hypothetical protein
MESMDRWVELKTGTYSSSVIFLTRRKVYRQKVAEIKWWLLG